MDDLHTSKIPLMRKKKVVFFLLTSDDGDRNLTYLLTQISAKIAGFSAKFAGIPAIWWLDKRANGRP